jgi:GR25 family glycosyltransferase involved in LPS biosynthesis
MTVMKIVMQIFIINIEDYSERRKFQTRQAEAMELEYEFVAAVNAMKLPEQVLQDAANNWSRPIVAKDVGCFLSHRKAWEAVHDHGERAIVIEDDVVFTKDFKSVISSLSSLEHEKDAIYDLEFVPRNHLMAKSTSKLLDGTGASITKIYQNKNGLGCYSICPSSASRLLKETNRFVLVDAFVWTRNWVQQFQVEPAPAIQMIFLDDVASHDNAKKSSLDKLYRNQSKLTAKLVSLKKLMTSARQVLVGRIFGVSRLIKCDLSKFAKPQIK